MDKRFILDHYRARVNVLKLRGNILTKYENAKLY